MKNSSFSWTFQYRLVDAGTGFFFLAAAVLCPAQVKLEKSAEISALDISQKRFLPTLLDTQTMIMDSNRTTRRSFDTTFKVKGKTHFIPKEE